MPSIRLMAVVLPAPLGPRIATHSPRSMLMSTPSRALTVPNALWTDLISITGAVGSSITTVPLLVRGDVCPVLARESGVIVVS